jgi:hypothetical protein
MRHYYIYTVQYMYIPNAAVYVSQKMGFFTVCLFLTFFFTVWELIQLCPNSLFRGLEKWLPGGRDQCRADL